MQSIPEPWDRLAEIKARVAAFDRYRGKRTSRAHFDFLDHARPDIGWLVGELEASLMAIDFIKQDGHTHPEEGNCLTCEAVAEFDARHE